MYYRRIVTINVLWLFLRVQCVGLQCMIVVFPDHTHLLFTWKKSCNNEEKTGLRTSMEIVFKPKVNQVWPMVKCI